MASAMIDSGATGNFMSTKFARQNGLARRRKETPYQLTVVDGTPLNDRQGWVTEETPPLEIQAQGRSLGKIGFDCVSIPHDIILGLPWLAECNPDIDWAKRRVTLKRAREEKTQPQQKATLPAEECRDEKVEICVISPREMQSIKKAAKEEIHCVWIKPINEPIAKVDGTPELHARNESQEELVTLPEEYTEFKKMFKEATVDALPEDQEWDHEIPLEDGKKPTYGPIYALSEKELEALRNYLDENLKKGFIRPSKSPAGYPILFVPKKDGKLRLCVDYRQLNAITIKNRHPLPLISELQDRIQGTKWFTKLDIQGAYNLVRMRNGEEWKTAFRTRYGHYEYTVMPFGLTNAPATFQALINSTLREYLDIFTTAYIDDILIYTKGSLEEHREHVKKVLEALNAAKMRLRLEKSQFHKQEVEFLGSILTTEGIKMDPTKITAVTDWKTPKNLKEVQAFIGLANFYRRFIKGYSSIVHPLTELTKKEKPFEWGTKQRTAFEELKKKFTTAPILASFDPTKRITIETDASDLALGSCLSQPDDQGRKRPVAYRSRKFTGPELNYDVHDKELLAIVDAFQEWRAYLEGARYTIEVYSDHKNLSYFTTTKKLNRRQVRWSELLASYDFKITYVKGKENGRADALSRRPDLMTRETTEQPILRIEGDSMVYAKPQLATSIPTNREYLPPGRRKRVIEEHHDGPLHGHPGREKTLEKIKRLYHWPRMKQDVEEYIRQCGHCAKNKATRHKPYGELQEIKIPRRAWEEITADFIVKLPKSNDPVTNVAYDAILVVVDRLTKYAYFIPWRESGTAADLANVMLRDIVSKHGVPEKIISDRDKLFTSKFWNTWSRQLGMKVSLSTAYHLRTDGQTERPNQTLEQYLRHYVNFKQNNWIELLPLAQFAYNDQAHSATGRTPFYANYGRHQRWSAVNNEKPEDAEAATTRVQDMQNLQLELSKNLEDKNKMTRHQSNKKRLKGPIFKGGDKVYLLRKNLRSKRPTPKLDHVRVGPFEVERKTSKVNYKLKLPRDAKIHPVFHVSLLERALDNAQVETEWNFESDAEYDVEAILDSRREDDGTISYKVKWLGYDETENSWEPTKNFSPEMATKMAEWHRRHPARPGPKANSGQGKATKMAPRQRDRRQR